MIDKNYLNRIYAQTERELRSMLLGVDIPSFTVAKAERIQFSVRQLINLLNIGTQKWAEQELRKAYQIGVKKARISLEVLGRKPKRMIPDAETRLVDNTVELLVQRNSTIRKTVDDFLRAALLGAQRIESAPIQEFNYDEAADVLDEYMRTALAEEKSRQWLKKKIMDYLLAGIAEGNLININGKMWNLRKYSKMVARTTLRKAQTKATADLCNQYDNDLVEVSDHNTDCEVCKEIEGNIYSLSGRSTTYPTMPMDFPPHPNCEHSLLPTSEEALRVRERWSHA
jgi:hypothetical protein